MRLPEWLRIGSENAASMFLVGLAAGAAMVGAEAVALGCLASALGIHLLAAAVRHPRLS